jgi:hypothetical protein
VRLGDSLWCLDSKIAPDSPMQEFVDQHQVAGFGNTKATPAMCNAKFVTVLGEEVLLVATDFIRRGEEIFPYYYNSKAKKALEMKRKAAAAARRAAKNGEEQNLRRPRTPPARLASKNLQRRRSWC